MAASTTFFDESDESGGSHSGIARQNRLSETRLFVEDLVGCLLDDPNNVSLIRSRISSQPPMNSQTRRSVSDPLAWLMGSLVVSSFGNDNLAKSLDIVTEALLKKNSDAKYVMAANVVALIAKVALASGLFFGMWLGHVWAFNKTGRARRASQVFLWAGTSLAPLALFATLINLVLECSYFNN